MPKKRTLDKSPAAPHRLLKPGTVIHDPLLFGANEDHGLVGIEHVERRGGSDQMALFFRSDGETKERREPFEPFILTAGNLLDDYRGELKSRRLEGNGTLNRQVSFSSWKDCLKAKAWLAKKTRIAPSSPTAPFLFLNDPVHQYLVVSGRTLFLGMDFDELKRMQVDIECYTTEGYEFCNAEREGDRIIAIAVADATGWVEVLSGAELEEKELLGRFVALVKERDPDVIEGHNIFNFDLPYIVKRAALHGVKLSIGRNGSVPKTRSSRLSIAERTLSYERCEVFGRSIVDTLFLVHAYDVTHRSLSGFGLKEVAVHFGFASPDRTYIEGAKIASEFRRRPEKVMKYVRDDVEETRSVGDLLSRSSFIQAQMLPYSYQNVCVRGNATKIDSLMTREYLRLGHALPLPDQPREFAGGYTDMFVEGIVENVHHCDIRSLYPSLMLTQKLAPKADELGVFLKMLEVLRDFRLMAKEGMNTSSSDAERAYDDSLQSTFKVLINSFYGYLGASTARFNDFAAAETVTAEGRSLLKFMIGWLKKNGARPIEIDTDGIYFVPPGKGSRKGKKNGIEAFREAFIASLPVGIEMEFDGEYKSMFSYKMKNYALLTFNGEMIIKGAALKSRGLEPFQRSFLSEMLRLKLEGRDNRIAALKASYEKAIRNGEWPIDMLAKTETLQDSPATYSAKLNAGKRSRSAVYELAQKSGREYRAGDQVSYYVTGEKKSVSVHKNAKMISEWNPKKRDENVAYYLAKLDALNTKFGGSSPQTEFDL